MRQSNPLLAALAWAVACAPAVPAGAHELYKDGGTHLNADVTVVSGAMRSKYNYDGRPGGSHWREGFAKYGLGGRTDRIGAGSVYGAFSLVSSGTWGDGDAGGMSNGTERRTSLEEAYVGWRSGDLFPALGNDGIDASAGRQVVKIGRGFLIHDDGLNSGNALAGGGLSRGGAYYIGARHAFGNTAVLRLGGRQGLHGSAMWLKSDNRAQAKTELAAATVDYTTQEGTLGLTYIRGLGVDPRYASPAQSLRKGMDVYSLRGEGNAGIQNADFAFEYARQRKSTGADTAWYVQAGYEFADVLWKPRLTYRHVRYGQNWDSLFTGGYMTWLQGEVAGNYAGPFNIRTRSHHVALTVKPSETVTVGAMFFDFRTLRGRSAANLDGRELDLYLEWVVHDHLIVSPLVGIYRPKAWSGNGGVQSGKGTNVYAQLLFIVPF